MELWLLLAWCPCYRNPQDQKSASTDVTRLLRNTQGVQATLLGSSKAAEGDPSYANFS